MISVIVSLFVPTPKGDFVKKSLELGYQEDTGDEYEDAIRAVRFNLKTWACEGDPSIIEASETPPGTKPLFKIVKVKDEWGEFDLPIKPCIRCGDDRIEYRENDDLCAYCEHIISKED